MQEEVRGQQEPWHQGHKSAIAGELAKAMAELLLHAIAADVLEILVGGELEEYHDEKHLAEGERVCPAALAV